MAPSPIPVILIIAAVFSFQALVVGDVYVQDAFNQPGEGETYGGLDVLGDIIDTIIGVATLIGNFFTFGAFLETEGAPFWIAVPVAVTMTGSLAWSIATLIRGN